MRTNRKRLAAVFAVIMILAVAITMTGCGGGNASGVVNAFFDSIDKHDVDKFFSCFQDDAVKQMKAFVSEEMLEMMDELLSDQFGDNWRKKVKVGKAEEVDKDDDATYYEVKVTLEGDDDYIPVVKVKGKFYLDQNAMGSWF